MVFNRSISERIAEFVTVKPLVFRTSIGMISFTFDDFPVSALEAGGNILERHQILATYYVAGGLTCTSQHTLTLHSKEDIRFALSRGHEIGSQGFAHLNYAKTSGAEIGADIEKNQHFLADVTGTKPQNFAYAFGARTISVKRQVGKCFVTARGIRRGINYSSCDLTDLRANALYPHVLTEARIRTLIETATTKGGWLIFYTHDVSDSPTVWGSTPALLECAVKEAVTSGCRILPIGKALDALSNLQRSI